MVQCSKCGLVGTQSEKHGGSVEVGRQFRETGELPPGDFYDHCEVLCFARRKRSFPRNPEPRKGALHEERECPGFLEWQPGFSPKEHVEMNLLEQQRAREDERDRRLEKWQRDQAEENRTYQECQDRRNFVVNLALVVANCALVIIGIAAAAAAWWAATHPTAIPVPQSQPAVAAPPAQATTTLPTKGPD
jgi:hypothetical protein